MGAIFNCFCRELALRSCGGVSFQNVPMTRFQVPVRVDIPAYGAVEVESDSFEQACLFVDNDIRQNGCNSVAADVEFEADWSNAHSLSLADSALPNDKDSSA